MGVAAHQGLVVVNFGKPVSFLGLDPATARALARSLNDRAEEAERHGA